MYAQEITELSEVADPIELYYGLTPQQSAFYDKVINEYFGENGQFRGAIYQPFAYEHRCEVDQLDEEGNFTYQQQRNLYDFMRRLLVKRFESSFGAFAKSVDNFIRTHSVVLEFIKRTGKYILDRSLIEKIWQEDDETIEAALQQFAERLADEEKLDPRHDHIYVIKTFTEPEQFLNDIRSDLVLLRQIAARVKSLELVEKDPKSKRCVEAIQEILEGPAKAGVPRRKVIVFSEYLDTVRHIAPVLQANFPGRVLVAEGLLSKRFFDDLLANFDAGHPSEKQRDDFDILVATINSLKG